jgi:protein-tyrosine phosphatase
MQSTTGTTTGTTGTAGATDQTTSATETAAPLEAGGSGLVVPGTWNVRDVGASGADGGARLRPGVLLRSATLSRLDPAGVEAVADLGVTAVLDLRGDDEIARDGADRLPPGARQVRLPFGGTRPSPGADTSDASVDGGAVADPLELVEQLVGAGDPAAAGRSVMLRLYAGFATDPAAHAAVAGALRTIADEQGAVLVHCSAGKDRTGWVVAVVQLLCGVAPEDVMAEYLRSAASATTLAATLPEVPGLDPAFWDAVTTVRAEYLETALHAVEEVYGSVEEYARAVCGEPDIVDALRARLTSTGATTV